MVFIHILDSAGNLVAQTDEMPNRGRHPTTAWLPEEIVTDHHHIAIPPATKPGIYHIIAGLYDAQTMQRLPIIDGTSDNAVRLGEFEVTVE